MNIEYINVNALIPYERNTKIHDEKQISNIAESIDKYGFVQPLVIDKNNVVVIGHGRLLAAKKLKMKDVPCVYVDDLTEEQVKALRIVDNKTALDTGFDFDILPDELLELDLSDFDFDFGIDTFEFESETEDVADEEKANERDRTDWAYNLPYFDEDKTEGKYQMPVLEPCYKIPKRMLGFNYAMTSDEYDACIHFYLDDYQFERVWNQPDKYIDILKRFDMVLTPSYSLYLNMAEPIKIYNVYRSRLLGQMMQNAGMHVVPLVYWADEQSFEYCFDGLPKNSILSTLTMGTSDPEVMEHWKKGMDELIKRKSPKTLLLYGNGLKVDYDFGDIKVLYYENEVTKRMEGLNKK